MYNVRMDFLNELNHHAYGLVGFSSENLHGHLQRVHKISVRANPDFFHEKYETFGIDESRYVKELHSSKAFTASSKRIFIIELSNITHEAQNSLLKMFEEPHEHTHFFVLIPSASILLPTLRSRLHIVEHQKEEHIGIPEAKKFLKLSTKEKIEYVDTLAKKISDEEAPKSEALEFLAALEIVQSENPEKNKRALEAILKARDYLNDRSPSIKQLLEFVALSF
jgi:DNA polymerase III delta prime subunit